MEEKNIAGRTFEYVCQIIPKTDQNRRTLEFFPQSRYDNRKKRPLHKYGAGPFCKFAMDGRRWKSGVYVIMADDVIQYVGECEDLYSRFNNGYGNISPRNCFGGGQPTNCRINSHILECHKSGTRIRLYFLELRDGSERFGIEDSLITRLEPPWNKTGGKSSK